MYCLVSGFLYPQPDESIQTRLGPLPPPRFSPSRTGGGTPFPSGDPISTFAFSPTRFFAHLEGETHFRWGKIDVRPNLYICQGIYFLPTDLGIGGGRSDA